MPSLDGEVAAWMRRHRSTVSNEQLEAIGISESQRRRLVSAGVIERVVTGAYRFAGVETDDLMRCAALCTSRPELVVAGPTAGRYWKFPRVPRDDLIHVLAPHSQPCREPWVRPYRTPLIDPDDVVVRIDGIRITTASRTAVDLTRYVDDESLATVTEHVLSKGVCTIASLQRCAERLNTPGRHWVRRFLRVLESRLPGAPRESSWELRVHTALVARGITDIESQVWQTIPGHGPARFDLAIPSLQMVIEVDVHPEHRTPSGRTSDIRRDRGSRRIGWAVERLGEEELRTGFDTAIDDVADAVRLRRAEVRRLNAAGLWPPPAL
jgi:very-short-patch-repair endonuclease